MRHHRRRPAILRFGWHQEKTCEDITPYGVITQFPKNGRLFTPKYRFITPSTFDHTEKICSHHQFSRSHRHNFVHTMKMLITLLKILFTPSKFCSHHLFSGSHRNNFVHTIKILFTLWKFWVTPSKFCSHHLNYIHTQE